MKHARRATSRAVIAVWAGSLLLALVVAGTVYSRLQPTLPEHPRPWIAPPAGGMDAEDEAIRRALWTASHLDPATAGLMRDCRAGGIRPPERYAAWIGRPGPLPDRPWSWQVRLELSDALVQVQVPEAPVPLSEPAAAGGGAVTHRLWLRRSQLSAIRRAWDRSTLWGRPSPRPGESSVPGPRILLESCVEGRYSAREHPLDPAAIRLFQAFDRLPRHAGPSR